MFYPSRIRLSPTLAPLATLLATIVSVPLMSGWSDSYWPLFEQFPYLLAGVLMTLAQMFNQGRLANLTLLITASFALIQTQLQVNLEANDKYEMYYWLSILFPLNLILIRLLPERRPLSLPGSVYLFMLIIQGGLITNLDTLLAPFATLQNLWASDIGWQHQLSPGLQEFLSAGHLGLLPFLSLVVSIVILGILIRPPWNNDLGFITLAFMFSGLFYSFATPHISILVASLAMMLLFATLVINNHRLAFVDELTNLPARRSLLNDLDHRWGSYCLVMADVDHFKQFNDTYGHDVGDEVLRAVAQQLGKAQGRGKAYRYGGEEFTLVFPIADDIRCQSYVEELRERIADYPLVIRNSKLRPDSNEKGEKQRQDVKHKNSKNGEALHVTMSFGVAQRRRGESTDSLFKRADKALYQAKNLGRNRVQLAER